MIRAGLLRHQVTLQRPRTSGDAFGEERAEWEDVVELRAAITPVSGTEQMAAAQLAATVTHQVTTRYWPGITPRMRLLYGQRVLNIVSVVDVDERRRELRMDCAEAV